MIKVNGDDLEWKEGMTVQDVLDAKKYTFKLISVWIGDTAVPKSAHATTLVPDGSDVQVIHNISGG